MKNSAPLFQLSRTLAIDFHCHGIGSFDFTEIPLIDLHKIEALLAERQYASVLTLYLPKTYFQDFLKLLNLYHEGKKKGEFKHIAGFGLEGPLLASHGGTPEEGVWLPSEKEWQILAQCSQVGLLYIILSPDAYLSGSHFHGKLDQAKMKWIFKTLLNGGVLPSPGHFTKQNPEASAKALQILFDEVRLWGQGAILTDHLYNDMPHAFKHAWRTPEEKVHRDDDLLSLHLENWSFENMDLTLGPVPASLIRYAKEGLVKICQNFDGEHVDLAIIKKTIELVGAKNMLMMTDSIESQKLAGRCLHFQKDSTLLYQEEGIVAAGSQSIHKQIENMNLIDLSPDQIVLLTCEVPHQIIQQQQRYLNEHVKIKTHHF